MGFHRNNTIFMILVVLLFAVSDNNIQQVVGIRPLLLIEGYASSASSILEIQSLQRGPVPPSGGSPCTYIPGRNRGRCTLADDPDQMGVAGRPPPPPASPDQPDDDVIQNSS